jgi:hypothetical protein
MTTWALTLGVWHHLAYTWDGTTIYMYVDGVLTGTQAEGGSFQHGNGARWDSNVNTGSAANQPGAVRFPMAWVDRILTPQDIHDLYTNPSPFQEGYLSQEVLQSVLVSVSDPPLNQTKPYIKPRHGGTGHGEIPRSVSTTFTFNYDDYIVEADTTSGTISGFLPNLDPRGTNRRFLCVNVGATNNVVMAVYGGGTIGGASSVTILPGQATVFVGGSSEWKVESASFDPSSLAASITSLTATVATKADKSTGLTATEGVQRTSGSDLSAAAQMKLDVNGLTADGSPDSAHDYVPTWDASASQHKKVLLSLIGGGGGNVGNAIDSDVTASRPGAAVTGTPASTNASTEATRPAAASAVAPKVQRGLYSARPTGNEGDLYIGSDVPSFGMSWLKQNGVWNALCHGETVTPSPASDWTASGGTITKDDTAGVLTLYSPTAEGGNVFYKAAPALPYTIIVRVIPILTTNNYSTFTVGWSDNSFKMEQVGIQYNSGWTFIDIKMNSIGNYNSTYATASGLLSMEQPWYPVCFKLTEDASNRTCYFSRDNGLNWTQIAQHGRTDFLTATRLIIAAQDGSSGSPAYAHVVSFEQS